MVDQPGKDADDVVVVSTNPDEHPEPAKSDFPSEARPEVDLTPPEPDK